MVSVKRQQKKVVSKSRSFKGPLSDLRQFMAIESPLQMMKNAFYFMLNALFGLEIFTF